MITHQCFICTLHPDKIERYEQLHNDISNANKRMMDEQGIRQLRIFRQESTLLMYVEWDSALRMEQPYVDIIVQKEWEEAIAECFDKPWVEVTEIYTFVTARQQGG